MTRCSLGGNSIDKAQLLSLAKLWRCTCLRSIILGIWTILPASWQPDPRLVAALGRLSSNDAGLVTLDLSGSPPADGDCLALALAAALAGNTTLASLKLRACGIGPFGIAGLAGWLATSTKLATLM